MKKFVTLLLLVMATPGFCEPVFAKDHKYLYYIPGQFGVYYGKAIYPYHPLIIFNKLAKIKVSGCEEEVIPARYNYCTIKKYLETDKANRSNLILTLIERKARYQQSQIIAIDEKEGF